MVILEMQSNPALISGFISILLEEKRYLSPLLVYFVQLCQVYMHQVV